MDSNDPCQLLIGEDWRLPTTDEIPVMSGNGLHLFESPLKIHAAGQFRSNGTFELPFWGSFWTRSEYESVDENDQPLFTDAYTLRISNNGLNLSDRDKASGLSIRCTKNKDQEVEELPEVSTLEINSIGAFQAHSKSFIHKNGGAEISKRGICLSKSSDPDLHDMCTDDGRGSRMFRSYISELEPETSYFLRAYATNKTGTAYGETLSFETKSEDDLPENTDCESIKVHHSVDDGNSPQNLEITYGTVEHNDACWIDRNLGAETVPVYSSDRTDVSLGWYWQFNEKQGYRFEGNNSVPDWPQDYIDNKSDWETANDPCNNLLGEEWRIPNFDELESFISKNQFELYNTPLRIHLNGSVLLDGSLNSIGHSGSYWSANQGPDYWGSGPVTGRILSILTGKAREGSAGKAGGRGIRCINKKENTSVTENDQSIVPKKFILHPNYPNPFNPVTVIRYELPTSSPVNFGVYDLTGRRITTLVDERQQAGVHEVTWDASGVASGIYIYRLQAGDFVQTRNMLLIK